MYCASGSIDDERRKNNKERAKAWTSLQLASKSSRIRCAGRRGGEGGVDAAKKPGGPAGSSSSKLNVQFSRPGGLRTPTAEAAAARAPRALASPWGSAHGGASGAPPRRGTAPPVPRSSAGPEAASAPASWPHPSPSVPGRLRQGRRGPGGSQLPSTRYCSPAAKPASPRCLTRSCWPCWDGLWMCVRSVRR